MSIRLATRSILRPHCHTPIASRYSAITTRARFRTRSKPQALPSSISLSTLAGAFVLSLVAVTAWSYSPSSAPEEPLQESVAADTDKPLWIQVYPGMSSQIPPGRPGNLTADQEVKLRELWEAVMGLCGTWPGAHIESETSSLAPDTTDSKKKGLGRLLGRSKKESKSEDAEDKHGQNKEFKEALATSSPEEIRDTMWSFSKCDDPDAMLLRFLRARKWNVHDALIMMISTIHWRGKVMHLDDDIMVNGEGGALEASKTGTGANKKNGEDFLAQMRMGKSFLHGEDKEGRPVCLVRVRLHKQGEQTETSLERYTVYTIETARLMLRPPVDTAVIMFDMTGFSMANMDYSPVKFMIKVFEANYPESLGAVLVHQAPWVFQGIWSVIKGWLDPVVASKVHFTKTADDLSKYIDMKHIPKDMGGQEDWVYKYVEPVQGENDRMSDLDTRKQIEAERASIVKEYEDLTIRWAKTGDASLKRTRLQLADRLRDNYWRLDPYVRARSLYDRWGVIQGAGRINFHPSANQAPNALNRGMNGLASSGGGLNRVSTDQKSVYYDAHDGVD